MIFTEATLDRFAVHYAGNKGNGQTFVLSGQEQDLNTESRIKLAELLLNRFQNSFERYSFYHASSLDYNEVYNYVSDIFDDPAQLYDRSVKIVTHLHEMSLHPKIKVGELYVGYFSNIMVEDRIVDAVGLFKAETKSVFADLDPDAEQMSLTLKEGVDISKIDKGCLILNQEHDKGFELLIVDSNGKTEEALYWKDKFLSVMIRQNEFVHTQDFLTITKNYVTQQMPGEFEVTKTEQIDILNRSMDYFKTHGSFNKEEFETEVLHHENLIESFRKYDNQYRQNHDMPAPEAFDISTQAVRKQTRVYKSVIKLDKNFHIYVHGDKQLIEKGFDEDLGKHYYKIYFDVET